MERRTLLRKRAGQISYLEGGHGVPILCLHGFPGSSYSWEAVALKLMEKYPDKYRFIIPDLLGFGESEVPNNDSIYMEGQSAAIAEFFTHLKISTIHLATHDFGGPVALTLMRTHPDLIVHKLIISATNLFTDTPIPFPLRSAGIPVLGKIVFHVMAGNLFGFRMMYEFASKDRRFFSWSDFRRHATSHGMKSTAKIFQYSLADLSQNYSPVQEYAGRLPVPTLILWGDSDPFFPLSVANRSKLSIPDSQIKVYQTVGHFVPEERSDEVATDLNDFFNS